MLIFFLSRNNILTKSQNEFRKGQLRQQYNLGSLMESNGEGGERTGMFMI
jgi:hypothetical protein